MEKPIVKTLSVWMGINSSEQKMEAFRKIAVIVIGGGQVQIKCPMLWALRVHIVRHQLFQNVVTALERSTFY